MSAASPENNRRESHRAPTQRRARVRRRGEFGAYFDAVVVDIAPFGLRLRCRVALEPGEELDIEVYPRDGGDEPIQVRGEVRHVQQGDDTLHAGLQLTVTLGNGAARQSLPGAEAVLRALRMELAALDAGAASRLMFHPDESTEATVPPLSDDVPQGRRRWRWRWLALAALLLLLALGAGVKMRTAAGPAREPGSEDAFSRMDAPAREGEAAPPVKREEVEAPPTPSEDLDGEVWEALGAGVNEGHMRDLALRLKTMKAGEDSPYVKHYMLAQLYWRLGERDNADAALVRLEEMEFNGTAPAAWVPKAAALRIAVSGDGPVAVEMPKPTLAVGEGMAVVDAPADVAEGEALEALPPAEIPVRLEVDASDHTLSVWKEEQLLASFPVGLGAEGATPLGEFEIVNKIAQPDWYNRGEVVPYGDPRNPLGEYWLGLGGGPGSSGIGIHPTQASHSIGGNESRGCIRMFAEDAGRVFAWCAVGTRIIIHP